jgi:trk system potassium uptake protein TrkH
MLGPAAKIIVAAAMVLGRLETLAILALLSPESWRR